MLKTYVSYLYSDRRECVAQCGRDPRHRRRLSPISHIFLPRHVARRVNRRRGIGGRVEQYGSVGLRGGGVVGGGVVGGGGPHIEGRA